MADYSETEAPENDTEGEILDTLAKSQPYAFVVATELEPLNLRVACNHPADTLQALLVQTLKAMPGGKNRISDGYHTFDELYDHRRALTVALCFALPHLAWRSKEHHPDDSPMFEGGYFIVGIDLPTGTITYHYKLSHWDDFAHVPELEHGRKWDGAPPSATVERLLALGQIEG